MQFRVGQFELGIVSDGLFRIDGGTMFGVVPRSIWGKLVDVDDLHRMELGLNSLVVRTPDALVLVETGIGTKLSEKACRFHAFREGTLVPELEKAGIRPGDVDFVILTHLHFDHVGGATARTESGPRPTFPNARYVIQKSEWLEAANPTGLTRAGYLDDDYLPIEKAGQLELIDGDVEITPGVTCRFTGGHTVGHQMVVVTSDGKTVCYPGDIMPTTLHVKPYYITSYDLNQKMTFEAKLALVAEACANDWLMAWGHDQHQPLSSLVTENGKVQATAAEVTS